MSEKKDNKIKWNEGQLEAITTRGSLLVLAAAGSGKTTVLTERIVRYILGEEKGSVANILAVTFTRASAADLKKKISKAIAKAAEEEQDTETKKRLMREISLIPSATISTIDGFCSELVRAEGGRLGLDPSLSVGEDSELKLLSREAMKEAVNHAYSSIEAFPLLADSVTKVKEENKTEEILLKTYTSVAYCPEGVEVLKKYAEGGDFFSSPSGIAAKKEIKRVTSAYRGRLEFLRDVLSPNDKTLYSAVLAGIDFADRLMTSLDTGYKEARELLSHSWKPKLSNPGKGKDELWHDVAVSAVNSFENYTVKTGGNKSLINTLFAHSYDEMLAAEERDRDLVLALYEVLKDYKKRYDAAKHRVGIMDFDDIEHFALQLLYSDQGKGEYNIPSPLARTLSETYDRVFIDEYQDVNPVQERIFAAIKRKDNAFTVGDIKQSIYGFRGSDPGGINSLFLKYEENAEEGRNVFMSENFRTKESILTYVNDVFDSLFSGDCGFSYSERDKLKACEGNRGGVKPVIIVAEKPPSGGIGTILSEAETVAKEIKRLVSEETLESGDRIEYKDIAILLRTATKMGEYAEALAAEGIPATSEEKKMLFGGGEARLAIALLAAIDNPYRDIELASVLFSPIYGFSADELFSVRRDEKSGALYDAIKHAAETGNEKAKRYISERERFFALSRRVSVAELIYTVYKETALPRIIRELAPDPISAKAAEEEIYMLYDYALGFESRSYKGLFAFLTYINDIVERKIERKSSTDTGNNVKIMTIHASKGLEFPVVFVSNTASSKLERNDPICFSRDAGVGILYRDGSGMALVSSPRKRAVMLSKKRQEEEEEQRIYYVALTRPKERLYITGCALNKNIIPMAEAEAAFGLLPTVPGGSFLFRFLAAAIRKKSADIILSDGIKDDEGPLSAEGEQTIISSDGERERAEGIKEKAMLFAEQMKAAEGFFYKNEYKTELPEKMSVSKLSPVAFDRAEPLLPDEERLTIDKKREKKLPTMKEKPEFLEKSGKSAADRGTATHQYLQFCDYENAEKEGADKELLRLIEKGFISKEMAELIDMAEIELFFKSSLYSEIRKAKKLWREFRFSSLFPARGLTSQELLREKLSGEEILIQGVIDGFYISEKDELVLFDYKTDRIKDMSDPGKELSLHHGLQLSYYAEALSRMFSYPPKKILIYSTQLGKSYQTENIYPKS